MSEAPHSSCTALARVLALPELVEHILRHLDMHQLFAMQRVCKAFQTLITNSRSLQHIMRLSHEPLKPPISYKPADYNILKMVNPLLCLHRNQLPKMLMTFNFVPHAAYLPRRKGFDNKLEIFIAAFSGLAIEQGAEEDAVVTFSLSPSGSWESTKLTNTPAVVHFTMEDFDGQAITAFIIEGDSTMTELRSRLGKEMGNYCLKKGR